MVGAAIRKEKDRIDAEIVGSEAKTCGEIVVVFARQAGRYEREQGLLALAMAIGFFLAAWMIAPRFQGGPGSPLWLSFFVSILIAGYSGGLLVAHLIPTLPMLIVRKSRRMHMAEERAAIAFHDLHVSNTRAHTGVLLFIAEAERAVVVLGDGPIAEKITQAEWEGVRDHILDGIRSRKVAEGLVTGIRRSGELLSLHFPKGKDDRDELPNGIYFIQ